MIWKWVLGMTVGLLREQSMNMFVFTVPEDKIELIFQTIQILHIKKSDWWMTSK